MSNVHPIFQPILDSIFPSQPPQKNSLLHDSIVTLLKRAHASDHSLIRKGEGYAFYGPKASQYEQDIREMAKALGQNYQEMEVNMVDCINQSGIKVADDHPLQGFTDWLIAGKPSK